MEEYKGRDCFITRRPLFSNQFKIYKEECSARPSFTEGPFLSHCATAFNFPAWCSHNSPSNIMSFPLISSGVRLNICVGPSNLHPYRRSYYGTCGGFIFFHLLYETVQLYRNIKITRVTFRWSGIMTTSRFNEPTSSGYNERLIGNQWSLCIRPSGPQRYLKQMSEIPLRSIKSRSV